MAESESIDAFRDRVTQAAPPERAAISHETYLVAEYSATTTLFPLGKLSGVCEMLIGGEASAELRINHGDVSPQHARIRHRDGRWYLEDLDSKSGTFDSAGRRVNRPLRLNLGEAFRLGKTVRATLHNGAGLMRLLMPGLPGPRSTKVLRRKALRDRLGADVELPPARREPASPPEKPEKPSTPIPGLRPGSVHLDFIEVRLEARKSDIERFSRRWPEPFVLRLAANQMPLDPPDLYYLTGESEEVIVGRDNTAGLTIPESSVSRRHAAFRRADGRWTLADLGSANGTWVGGRPLRAEMTLRDENEIWFGPDCPSRVLVGARLWVFMQGSSGPLDDD